MALSKISTALSARIESINHTATYGDPPGKDPFVAHLTSIQEHVSKPIDRQNGESRQEMGVLLLLAQVTVDVFEKIEDAAAQTPDCPLLRPDAPAARTPLASSLTLSCMILFLTNLTQKDPNQPMVVETTLESASKAKGTTIRVSHCREKSSDSDAWQILRSQIGVEIKPFEDSTTAASGYELVFTSE